MDTELCDLLTFHYTDYKREYKTVPCALMLHVFH